ncbi:MAG: hypothetical protein K2J65_08705 [Duncaniella sp.]|nr:hypothetical protein [Duncaniella sp.]
MNKLLIVIVASILGSVAVACGTRGGSSSAVGAVGDYGSEAIPAVIRALANNDASEFAMMCTYPVTRKYPLHDIMDSAQMVAYYHLLVDDSLRTVISSSSPDDWWQAGWRGYTYDNGEYLWIDMGVYGVNYESQLEKAMRDSLLAADAAAVHISLRGDWLPETCLFDSVSGQVLRIDIASTDEPDDSYELPKARLAIYDKGADLRSAPDKILFGRLNIEGSAATHVYEFNDGDSSPLTILYYPYEAIYTLASDDGEDSRTLAKTYFLDLIDSLALTKSTVSASPALNRL